MSQLSLHKNNKILKGEILLPGSKSESNRVLIIQALCKDPFKIHNLSPAEDTSSLELGVKSLEPEINVGYAGTTFRFLTSYYSLQEEREIILTGTERMKQRPIGPLVNALRSLGAEISYVENEGYPPLKIKGKKLSLSKEIYIDASISSQFISSLLLIAPVLPDGLILHMEKEMVSEPYIEMTLSLMQYFGVVHRKENNTIIIEHQEYKAKDIHIEADWSAASYWYAMAALSNEVDLTLKGLKGYSLQGDQVTSELMANFGVASEFMNDGVRLKKIAKKVERKIFDFKDCPDLAQTIIVTCAALKHEATFTGLQTLRIKETDRIQALQNELKKFGAILTEKGQVFKLSFTEEPVENKIIETYHDHRMAMSFAPLALLQPITINDPDVVIKSYPSFWEDLRLAGFVLNGDEK